MTDLVKVHSIPGWQAEMYRIFLESLDFQVMVVQESAGQTLGLTIGSLGEAHIYARQQDAEAIRETLRKLDAGEYSLGWWSVADDRDVPNPDTEP